MEKTNARFWIQFSNGYSNASFQAMKNFLTSLNDDTYGASRDTAILIIEGLILDTVNADTATNATIFLNRLVGFTEGLAVYANPALPESRIYQYFYDALSLAEIVPYEDRLDN